MPDVPTPPGGGSRQQRAAELRREMEQRQAAEGEAARSEAEQEASAPSPEQQEAQPADAMEEQSATEPTGTGPVGEGEYVVKQGDCISSIGMESGHFPDTIWNDPANSELKNLRKNPNTLLPGDCVTIPPLRRKEEPGDTEMRHRFRRKGQPEMLRIRLLDEFQQPRTNIRYVLVIDGDQRENVTNEEGELEEPIPPNAKRGTLTLYEGGDDEGEEIPLELGHIDPITEISGIQARLANLGFDCDPDSGQLDARTRQAIEQFQRQHKLNPTGEPDQATINEIEKRYGS